MGQTPSFAFFPALGSTHTVPIPTPSASDNDSSDKVREGASVQLVFRARLNREEALGCQRDGVQLQAWTDAPVEGRGTGEWAAYTFGQPDVDLPSHGLVDSEAAPFVLSSDAVVEPEPEGQACWTLKLRLRRDALGESESERRFLLTYRLLYPNGEVRWLGSPGHDVVCILQRADPWLNVSDAWAVAPRDGGRDFEARGQAEADSDCVEFARVCQADRWGCWAIGDSSVRYHETGSEVKGATFIVLLTTPGRNTFALQQPVALHARSGGTLSLSASGIVTCSPNTLVHVSSLAFSRFIPSLNAAASALNLRCLGTHSGHVVLSSTEYPALVSFIPLPSDLGTSETASFHALFSNLGLPATDGVTLYVMYSQSMLRLVEATKPVAFSVGPAGGECIVSCVYEVEADESEAEPGDDPWHVAILTPHTYVEPEVEPKSELTLSSDAPGMMGEDTPSVPKSEPEPTLELQDIQNAHSDDSDSELETLASRSVSSDLALAMPGAPSSNLLGASPEVDVAATLQGLLALLLRAFFVLRVLAAVHVLGIVVNADKEKAKERKEEEKERHVRDALAYDEEEEKRVPGRSEIDTLSVIDELTEEEDRLRVVDNDDEGAASDSTLAPNSPLLTTAAISIGKSARRPQTFDVEKGSLSAALYPPTRLRDLEVDLQLILDGQLQPTAKVKVQGALLVHVEGGVQGGRLTVRINGRPAAQGYEEVDV